VLAGAAVLHSSLMLHHCPIPICCAEFNVVLG